MKWMMIGAVATALVGAANAATVQLDVMASEGADTITMTAVFERSVTAGDASGQGFNFDPAALVSATFDWTIGGVVGTSSYDQTETTNGPASIQQRKSLAVPAVNTFAFSYFCKAAPCVPSFAGVNLVSKTADIFFDAKESLLENVLDPAANTFSNYQLQGAAGAGEGYSWLRIEDRQIEIDSVRFSDPNATEPEPDPNVVPLPAGLPLLLAGLGVMAVLRRRHEP